MSLVLAWMLACADAPEHDGRRAPPACLTEDEAGVLARHLAALDGLAWLVADLVAGRPLGFAALVGAAPLGPETLQHGCARPDSGVPCEEDAPCWQTRCEGSGWTAQASPPLQPDPGWVLGGVRVEIRWTAQSPEALACTAEASSADADGTDWSVRQHLTLAEGRVALAESYPGLRPGWDVLLRAAGGIGSVEAEGHPLAAVQGHAVRPACDP